jgi:hypothetical protein
MSDQSSEASTLDQIKSAFSAPRGSASGTASETSAKVQRRNSRFKVVTSRESSLLPAVGHPRGWANKAPSPAEDEAVDAPWKSHACVLLFLGDSVRTANVLLTRRTNDSRFDIAPDSTETNNNQRAQAAESSTAAPDAARTDDTSSPTRA